MSNTVSSQSLQIQKLIDLSMEKNKISYDQTTKQDKRIV